MDKYLLFFLAAITVTLAGCTQNNDECAALSGPAKDNCYNDAALNALEVDSCYKITSSVFKDSCIAELGVLTNNTELCGQANLQSRSYCYSSIASSRFELSLCNSVEDSQWKDTCIGKIAVQGEDILLCREIANVKSRDDCFLTLAVKLNDSDSCAFVFEEVGRDRCFVNVAIALQNTSLCVLTTHPLAHDVCYKNVARAMNDSVVCAEIVHPQIRSDCNNFFT